MTTPRTPPTSGTTEPARSDAGRAVPFLAAVSAVLALLGLGLAGWTWFDTYTYVARPHEDVSLHGLGYVLAAVIGVPAALALSMAGLGWWLGRRGHVGWGIGLSSAALAITAPLALLIVFFALR